MNTTIELEKLYDKEFRNQIIKTPNSIKKLINAEGSEDLEFVIRVNTKDTTYIAIPVGYVTADDIENIQAAGNTSGSAGTAASGSTAGSICSTLSSASSVGTASSVSTAES